MLKHDGSLKTRRESLHVSAFGKLACVYNFHSPTLPKMSKDLSSFLDLHGSHLRHSLVP